MSRNQKLNLAILTLINTWMILVPFYGTLFDKMVLRSDNELKTAQIICLFAYQLSIVGFTFVLKEHNVKRLMNTGLIFLIVFSLLMWFLTGLQGFLSYLLLGLASGLVRAVFCHYFIYGFDNKVSIREIGLIFFGSYLGVCLFKYASNLFGTEISFIVATLILVLILILNTLFDKNELTCQSAKAEYPFPYKPILFIGFVFFIALFINGLMRNTLYPRSEALNSGIMYNLEFVPEVVMFFVVYLFYKKIDRLLLLNSTVAFIGIACLGYIIYGGVNVPANLLVDLSIATFDVFLYSIIIDVSRIYGRSYKVFRAVMIVFSAGALLGDFTGKQFEIYTKADPILISVVLLAIIFLYVFTLPWINKYIKADFIEPKQLKREESETQQVSAEVEFMNGRVRESEDAGSGEKLRYANSILPEGRRLTAREYEIAELLIKRYDNGSISEMLFISPNTLKVHIRHIYQKFEASSKKEFNEQVNKLQGIILK